MKILEILKENKSPEISEAADILNKMFKRKGRTISWTSDSPPTIRDLVIQLDDPLISLFATSLKSFIYYGQKWLDIDPNDIWNTTSDVPNVDDMLADPEYFKTQKNTVFKIAHFRPEMYAIYCDHGFSGKHFIPEQHLVKQYAFQVLNGSKMPLPYLKYELINNKINFDQEGRHRAKVAELFEATQMPCIIIAKTQDQEDLNQFSKRIFNKFK